MPNEKEKENEIVNRFTGFNWSNDNDKTFDLIDQFQLDFGNPSLIAFTLRYLIFFLFYKNSILLQIFIHPPNQY